MTSGPGASPSELPPGAPPAAPPTAPPNGAAWLLAGAAAIVPILAIVVFTRVMIGAEGPSTRGVAPDSLVLQGPLVRAFAWAALGVAAALLTLAIVRLRGQWRPLVLMIVGVVLAGAAACSGTFWYSFAAAPRTVLPAMTAHDGREYAVVHYSMMQGMTLRICRVERDDVWARELVTLASALFDSPRRFQHVLVPAGRADPPSYLYESADGFLICGVHGEGALLRAFVACHAPSETAYANEGAYFLSPFVLFGPGDAGDEVALDALVAYVAEHVESPDAVGMPRDDVLVADIEHPSAWVRAASARLVRAGGAERYPLATARLERGR